MKSGFTLIELLVVIAIIGLLSSIIILNTQNIRFQANDAKIQELMFQVRNAAEMLYDKTETYSQVCQESDNTLRDAGELENLEKAIKRENGNRNVNCFEGSDRASFAASSPLRINPNKSWCVESAAGSAELNCSAINSASCVCP